MPNNDSGYINIVKSIKSSKFKWTYHLSLAEYKTVLKKCSLLIGNSSSGIHEAATYKKPVINIGTRQINRLKSKNVIDVECNYKDILKKIKFCLSNKKFQKDLIKIRNLYGTGNSAKKIIKIIENLNLKINTQKINTY
jgi:UDP-N-acetylglucosamine 2-epimerase